MSVLRASERTIPVRTLLVAAAVAMLAAAVISIKDTLILVFLGVFLALVFEIPLRAFMRWTKWGRGISATIVVLGSAVGVALLGLLLLVPLVGKSAGGAQRWLPLGPVQFQPAEAAKIALVLYLARSLARKQDRIRLFSIGLLPHLVVTAALVAMCLWQRDLGTGVILFVVLFAMLFAAGARVSYLLLAAVAAAPVAWHLVKSTPYRYARVVAFLDPERYRSGPGFQLWESLLGTANGGFLGQGLGQGKGKLFYLPAAHTDFIAAVIAEEAGLLGVLLLVALFALLVWRGLRAALNASEPFGCYAALGMTTLIGAQALVNLAVVFGLLPTKGLTLPFVSYGGSSLLTLLGGAGVLLSISGERGGFLRRPIQAVRVAPAAAAEGAP